MEIPSLWTYVHGEARRGEEPSVVFKILVQEIEHNMLAVSSKLQGGLTDYVAAAPGPVVCQ